MAAGVSSFVFNGAGRLPEALKRAARFEKLGSL